MYTLKVICMPNLCSLARLSFSSTFSSCHQLLTAVDSWWQLTWIKIKWNFYLQTKIYTCAKFQLSRLIFIFISCHQLLTAVGGWWQLIWKKSTEIFNAHTQLYTCAKFQFSRLIFIFINCYQLLTPDDSWYEKKLTWIFMYKLKLVLVPNFSSLE